MDLKNEGAMFLVVPPSCTYILLGISYNLSTSVLKKYKTTLASRNVQS